MNFWMGVRRQLITNIHSNKTKKLPLRRTENAQKYILMKRRITDLMTRVLSRAGVTQKHLEFMGIPLTGTIDAFQKKLVAKGCSVSAENEFAPAGWRYFEGTFAGKKAEITVWYNERSKIVYAATVRIPCSTLGMVRILFDEYKELLGKKYEENGISTDEWIDVYKIDGKREDNHYDWSIYDNLNRENETYLGYIDIEKKLDDDDLCLTIDYHDAQNYDKHKKDRMSDL